MHSCPTCAAHQQTIVMLADQIDWLRTQIAGSAVTAVTPVTSAPRDADLAVDFPDLAPVDKSLWLDEDAEDIEAMVEAGAISMAEAEKALAAVQAQNTHIELVK